MGQKIKYFSFITQSSKESRNQSVHRLKTGNPVEFLEWTMTSNLATIIIKIKRNCPNLVELWTSSTHAKIAGLTATRPRAVIKVPLSLFVDIGGDIASHRKYTLCSSVPS